MAFRSKSNRGRVNYSNANQRLPLNPKNYYSQSYVTSYTRSRSRHAFGSTPLGVFEDRRQWNPSGTSAPARSFSATRHRLKMVGSVAQRKAGRPFSSLPWKIVSNGVGFQNPSRVLICVRRKIRREVMHATGKAGSGQRRQAPPRRSEYSSVSC